ncbi:hypothetical protein EIP91_009506 [Steccherinum ochraceum]|uniref:HCP-like protein n=1 Tax=Steccherinum ochraceum TaxID=92696 RepID=A0A4R0R485_9APHY|nr:hypothetical protein EIP91_009506 [Steccherinum ochraceum]
MALNRGTSPGPIPSPSAFQHTSPLTTLVRKVSSRRAHDQTGTLQQLTPPRTVQPHYNAPASPLLHTQFRTSTSTTTTYDERNSYLVDEDRSTMTWGNGLDIGQGEADGSMPTSRGSSYSRNARVQSMASVYSDTDDSGSPRASWQPMEAPEAARTSYAAGRHPIQNQARGPPYSAVSAGVSNAWPEPIAPAVHSTPSPPQQAGRVPSQLPPGHRTANLSRPVPPIIDGTEQRKREVLSRNARAQSPFLKSMKHESASPSIVPSIRVQEAEPEYLQPMLSAPSYQTSFGESNGLPRAPSPSSNSLYSSYSYYPYEGGVDTPPGSNTPQADQGHFPQSSKTKSPTPSLKSRDADSYSLSSPDALNHPRTPQDFLQLGITHHMANRLEESARCFEQSATLNKGCGVGMLMWGLTLRHGWGVPPNEEKGFKWLRKAAEDAVSDLESAQAGMSDTSAIKSELVIAIYEVGQSFFRGWGVEKDKPMGVNYFRVAARLGDMDAQQNLAFALEHGKGCKKDRKEAAKWYREAVKQGYSDIGLAWIHKDKFL